MRKKVSKVSLVKPNNDALLHTGDIPERVRGCSDFKSILNHFKTHKLIFKWSNPDILGPGITPPYKLHQEPDFHTIDTAVTKVTFLLGNYPTLLMALGYKPEICNRGYGGLLSESDEEIKNKLKSESLKAIVKPLRQSYKKEIIFLNTTHQLSSVALDSTPSPLVKPFVLLPYARTSLRMATKLGAFTFEYPKIPRTCHFVYPQNSKLLEAMTVSAVWLRYMSHTIYSFNVEALVEPYITEYKLLAYLYSRAKTEMLRFTWRKLSRPTGSTTCWLCNSSKSTEMFNCINCFACNDCCSHGTELMKCFNCTLNFCSLPWGLEGPCMGCAMCSYCCTCAECRGCAKRRSIITYHGFCRGNCGMCHECCKCIKERSDKNYFLGTIPTGSQYSPIEAICAHYALEEAGIVAAQHDVAGSQAAATKIRLYRESIAKEHTALLKEFSGLLFDHTVLSCLGELRHFTTKTSGIPDYLGWRNPSYQAVVEEILGWSNQQVIQALHDLTPLAQHATGSGRPGAVMDRSAVYYFVKHEGNALQDLATALFLFCEVPWDSSFGGGLWGVIAKCALEFGLGITSVKEFVERAISLAHNSGSYLDKGTRIFDSKLLESKGKAILNRKLLGSLLQSEYPSILLRKSVASIIKQGAEEGILEVKVPIYEMLQPHIPTITGWIDRMHDGPWPIDPRKVLAFVTHPSTKAYTALLSGIGTLELRRQAVLTNEEPVLN